MGLMSARLDICAMVKALVLLEVNDWCHPGVRAIAPEEPWAWAMPDGS